MDMITIQTVTTISNAMASDIKDMNFYVKFT